MSLVIQTNVASQQTQKTMSRSQQALTASFNRLSSGYRINSAKDDAAGLAISESMTSQTRSFTVAARNANDAISMAQTAEGGLGEISGILGRMRELAMQGSNGALQSSDRAYIQTEFSALQSEIGRIMTSTKFNGHQLIAQTSHTLKFQIGINNLSSDRQEITFGNIDLAAVQAASTAVSGSAGNSQAALDKIDTAVATISNARARFGAAINRLEITTSNVETARLNISAANSRIRDVDVAEETAALSRSQVLMQAGTSILAQANSTPQQALSLLRG